VANWQESSFAKKDLDTLADKKLNMRQQCVLAENEATISWPTLGRAFVSSSRVLPEVVTALCKGETPLQYCVHLHIPQDKREMDILEHKQ